MSKKSSPGKIITFYSYKGGTGRSMMLANVAWILASNGKKVLAIDWDLEAPGLHRYFYPFLTDKDSAFSDGVINFVTNYKIKLMRPPAEGVTVAADWFIEYANIKEYASTLRWEFESDGRLDFVPPGRQDDSYSSLISLFNWQDFYERLGGKRFLDETQKKMREDYDYILVDSRTGVSDTSGICTIHMPDALVVCFTLNYQSINGASNVANIVLDERTKLEALDIATQPDLAAARAGRPDFDIYPLPTRLEYAEKDKLDLMRDYARNKFSQFPRFLSGTTKEQYWENTFVHYEPYYAYEELLAAFGEKSRARDSLLVAAEHLASFLTEGKVTQLPTLPHPKRDEILAAFKGGPPKTEVTETLVHLADKAFVVLNSDQQQIGQRLLLRAIRLARPDEVDGRNTRQRVNLKDFDSVANQVIEVLSKDQIVEIIEDPVTKDRSLQITQDALVQDWKPLRDWIESDRSFLLWRQELQPLVEQWSRNRTDERLLLRDSQLHLAHNYYKQRNHYLDFTAAELDFIQASVSQQSTRDTLNVGSTGPHVFVVMPFGVKEVQAATLPSDSTPGKPQVNLNFDEVYESLISPALIRAGCVPFRADKEPGAGDIRTDMYFELVTADVILADVSILNANVFYELGIRHGVAPRGVLMIHGGWAKRPFDVAPDRTFDYEGSLFTKGGEARDEAWRQRLDFEADRLGGLLSAALIADEQTIGSPVYKELVGLKPVDWSNIQTARAKYFGEVFADWKSRVEVAKLNGWPGDILTLADDAPTRFHRGKLLWEAADALFSMQRFNAARSVLEDLLVVDPKNRRALTQFGLVLSRLGRINEAKVHMLRVAEEFAGDPEAQGILGRVYKDLWRLEWKDLESLEDRQLQAVATSGFIASAVRSYDLSARKHFDYYTGINVVTFVKLLEHLKQATNDEPVDSRIKDIDDMASVVRFAAENTLNVSGLDTGQDAVWAAATLGELELVMGNTDRARILYRDAANAPATTYFNVNSMLDQIYLFESLGFQPEAVAAVKKVLELRRNLLERKVGGLKKSEPRFKKVVLASGHMIDTPDRVTKGLGERFPAGKESVVRERIANQLNSWAVGAGDLAICGGARGADLLFAELCAELGAEVWLYLALPEADFLEASVRLADSDWEGRFFNLRDRELVKVFLQSDRLKTPPKGTSVFARNNLWMINTARVEANDPKNLYAMLVWDEKPSGDGPGGTSDFAARVRRIGGRLAPIINPTKL